MLPCFCAQLETCRRRPPGLGFCPHRSPPFTFLNPDPAMGFSVPAQRDKQKSQKIVEACKAKNQQPNHTNTSTRVQAQAQAQAQASASALSKATAGKQTAATDRLDPAGEEPERGEAPTATHTRAPVPRPITASPGPQPLIIAACWDVFFLALPMCSHVLVLVRTCTVSHVQAPAHTGTVPAWPDVQLPYSTCTGMYRASERRVSQSLPSNRAGVVSSLNLSGSLPSIH